MGSWTKLRALRFFFNDTATTEIYTLSLHDALPISRHLEVGRCAALGARAERAPQRFGRDRKSTRLNSSHLVISYAVFCLKKKTHEYMELDGSELERTIYVKKDAAPLLAWAVATNNS